MLRCVFTAGLAVASTLLLACGQQADQEPIELVDDAPVLGVWFLQAAGDKPVAIDSTIRFEFKPHGSASYERTAGGPEEPDHYELTYNLTGDIISIVGESDAPGTPRLTGRIELEDNGQTLRINTHTDEDWLLTRAEKPGGAVEDARRVQQSGNRADPRLVRVQRLAYACSAYATRQGGPPEHIFDLIDAGLIKPEDVLASGKAADVPARFERMTEPEQRGWLEANSAYVFFFRYAGTGQASSVVVSTLPENGKSQVVVGMANGAVFIKPAKQAAQLLQFQIGELPDRWPDSAWSREAAVGLEPLSD